MTPIIRGENILIRRNIKDMFGNPIPLSEFSSIAVSIERKKGVVLKTYSYPSLDLRLGVNNSQLELEITSDVSLTLPNVDIYIRYVFKKPDAEFEDDLNLVDIIREKVLEVSI